MAKYKYMSFNWDGDAVECDKKLDSQFISWFPCGDLYGGADYSIDWENRLYHFRRYEWMELDAEGCRAFIKKDRAPQHSAINLWADEPFRR